jgi:hypothetical protein
MPRDFNAKAQRGKPQPKHGGEVGEKALAKRWRQKYKNRNTCNPW